MYGKIVDGDIVYLTLPIKTEDQDIFTNDVDVLLQYGYKEIIFTDPPEVPEGYKLETVWVEEDRVIRQEWNLVPEENNHCDNDSCEIVYSEDS